MSVLRLNCTHRLIQLRRFIFWHCSRRSKLDMLLCIEAARMHHGHTTMQGIQYVITRRDNGVAFFHPVPALPHPGERKRSFSLEVHDSGFNIRLHPITENRSEDDATEPQTK